MNRSILISFLEFKSTKQDLKNILGDDLFNVKIKPAIVDSQHVIYAIENFVGGKIEISQLMDWVNIVWFTDLYEYNSKQSDSISSVMSVLETLDEPDVNVSDNDFKLMIECLKKNQNYN